MLAASLVALVSGVTVTVPAQRSFCPGFPEAELYEGETTGEVLFGSWDHEVVDDDEHALKVVLRSFRVERGAGNVTRRSDEQVLKTWWAHAQRTFHHEVATASGVGYELCFESKHSFPLRVGFHLHRGPHLTSDGLTKRDWVSPRQRHTALAVRLLWQARELKERQGFEHTTEDEHMKTAESLLDRLHVCTSLKLGTLVIFSVAQVYYLKSFFESKQSI